MNHRLYDPDRDREAVRRIWREVGWIEDDDGNKGQDLEIEASRALVADLNGEPECMVLSAAGAIRYLSTDLPFWCIVGVTTSRLGRKQGFAGSLTAASVAEAAADGAQVVGLGMFEQGYYNQLGFAAGCHDHRVSLDPSSLLVGVRARAPRRITEDDFDLVHASRLARLRGHGSVSMTHPNFTHAYMTWDKGKCFGLGYCDGPKGELTHHFWCSAEKTDHGPYSVSWMTYQTRAQFLELLALIKGLGDQVRLIELNEPPLFQLQDLIEKPFHRYEVTKGSDFACKTEAIAWWQARICDLPGCVAASRLAGDPVRFNLKLTDPIERFLDDTARWRGIGGDYVVTLGPESSAEPGAAPGLPTLEASVNAFTRMWLGVRPPSGLTFTDSLAGPDDLIAALDRLMLLPRPSFEWGL